jgi:hypothetical protein
MKADPEWKAFIDQKRADKIVNSAMVKGQDLGFFTSRPSSLSSLSSLSSPAEMAISACPSSNSIRDQ